MFLAVTTVQGDLPVLFLTVHLKMVSGQNPGVVLPGSWSVKGKSGSPEETCVVNGPGKGNLQIQVGRKSCMFYPIEVGIILR